MTEVHAEPLEILRTRTSEKWRAYPADVLPLFVAEMDYPLAPVVRDAIIERVAANDTGYVSEFGPLGEAFAGYAARTWGWTVDAAAVRPTTDVSVAIVETLRMAISPGDRVVIAPPVYPPFFELIPEAGGVVVEVPLLGAPVAGSADGAWSLDLAGLEAAFAAGASAFLLCNPHNPLGVVHEASTLMAVAALAAKYGVIVVSDEIHGPLAHSGTEFTPFLSVSQDAADWGLCVTSASKAFNLAGVKCALMVAASPRMLELLDGMPVEVGVRTSLLGLHASIAGLTHGDDWLAGTVAAIEASSALLGELLASQLPGVVFRPPSASYLAWLDFRAAGWGDDPAARALAAGVALNPGTDFGAEGSGFARLNLACSPEVLTEAIHRLAAA